MSKRAEGMSRLARAALPTLLGLAGVLLLALPVRFGAGVVPTPLLPLLIIFFWSIYGPSYMPAGSVFTIGLMQDLLSGGPLGLWPAVYLLTQFIVLSQRNYFLGREQKVVIIGFAFAALGAGLVWWLVMSLMSGIVLPPLGMLMQLAVTVACYPLFGVAFAHLHRRVLVEA